MADALDDPRRAGAGGASSEAAQCSRCRPSARTRTTRDVDFAELGGQQALPHPRRDRRRQDQHPRRDRLRPLRRHERGRAQAAQMRCESADPAPPTEVIFDFALGPADRSGWRAARRRSSAGAQRRGRRRKPAEAALWETTEAAPDAEGELLATQIGTWTKVVHGAPRLLVGAVPAGRRAATGQVPGAAGGAAPISARRSCGSSSGPRNARSSSAVSRSGRARSFGGARTSR